ncbi:MAG: hypothetical protein AAF485_09695 [Chloroflexota bacterium]
MIPETITTFADLIQIIKTNPELRQELRDALFPEFDITFQEIKEAIQALTQAQQRTEGMLQQLILLSFPVSMHSRLHFVTF